MWKTDGTKATWNSLFHLDLANPAEGVEVHGARILQTIRGGSESGPPDSGGRLITLVPLNLVESYIRGQDCIANYAPIPPDQVQPQIYWRGSFDAEDNIASLEMILSMQTSLLD